MKEEGKSRYFGFFAKNPKDTRHHQAAQIFHFELADDPFDVAVGIANYSVDTPLKLDFSASAGLFSEVFVVGYPQNILNRSNQAFWLSLRGHKGEVQRAWDPGNYGLDGHPSGFELSFPVTAGLSGSPLLLDAPVSEDRVRVVGVCVGSHSAEIVQDSFQEINDAGKVYSEKRLKMEEYGIAHDLRPLQDWSPESLSGQSLGHIASLEIPIEVIKSIMPAVLVGD